MKKRKKIISLVFILTLSIFCSIVTVNAASKTQSVPVNTSVGSATLTTTADASTRKVISQYVKTSQRSASIKNTTVLCGSELLADGKIQVKTTVTVIDWNYNSANGTVTQTFTR